MRMLIWLLIVSVALLGRNITVTAQDIPISNEAIWELSWRPDGTEIAFGNFDGTVTIANASNNQVVRTLQTGTTAGLVATAWSPDGTMVASSSRNLSVYVWNASSGQLIRTLTGSNVDFISYLVWNSTSSNIAGVSYLDHKMQVWDVNSGNLVFTQNSVDSALDWHGNEIVAGTGTGLSVFNGTNGTYIKTIGLHSSILIAATWSPDGSQIATGTSNGTISIWDANIVQNSTRSIPPTYLLTSHTLPVISVDWHPNGEILASAGLSHQPKLFK